MRTACRIIALLASWTQLATAQTERIDRVVVRGAHRTRESTIASLLPRPIPTVLSPVELVELERRLYNLGIFDRVQLTVEGTRLRVDVREKWTLIPSLEFASGRTLVDSYVSLGATEYNFLGTAAQLGLALSWDERRPNGYSYLAQHAYDPRSGAWFGEAYFASASLRFATSEAWNRDQIGGALGFQIPYGYEAPLRVKAGVWGYRERVSSIEGAVDPGSGTAFGSELMMSWDSYSWRDLAPYGYSFELTLQSGAFLPAGEPRHSVSLKSLFALAPTATTALTAQVMAAAVSDGNVNHSVPLGSVREVRGLAGAFYRNQAQLVLNLELRQAWRFAERWALQGVLFADSAVFAAMDVHGVRQAADHAFASGAGVRVIPTALAQVVLRLDAGRLLAPEQLWFAQFGLAQFF